MAMTREARARVTTAVNAMRMRGDGAEVSSVMGGSLLSGRRGEGLCLRRVSIR